MSTLSKSAHKLLPMLQKCICILFNAARAITRQQKALWEHLLVSDAGKDFLYLPHHQLWYDLTQLMHNLPIFGLDYEHRTDHVFPQFKVLQGGIKSIARKPHQQFFWASLILCIQMYQTRMEFYLSNSLKSNYKRIMGHALLHYICPIIISDNCGLGTIHMN